MPRRISDYPDAFAGWNLISSFGSVISVIATWLFLYIVYVQLVDGKATSRYPWLTPQFYSDSLQTLLNRSYNSLEWALTSPPKPHAFVSLPLQSFSFSPLKFLRRNIYKIVTIFFIGLFFRIIINSINIVDFFKDYLNPWSLGYFFAMAITIPLVYEIYDNFDSGIYSMDRRNPFKSPHSNPVGGGSSNPTGSGSNIPSNVTEEQRLEEIRLRMLKENKATKPLSAEELNAIKEQDALIVTGKQKLEKIAAHNKANNQNLGVSSNTPEWGLIALTEAEIKAITNKIKYDDNASEYLKDKFGSSGKIKGAIRSKGALLEYLKNIPKSN